VCASSRRTASGWGRGTPQRGSPESRSSSALEPRGPLDANQMPARMQPLIDGELVELSAGRRGDRTRKYRLTDEAKGEALAAIVSDLSLGGVVPDEVFEHDFAWVVERLWDETLSRNERGRSLEVLAGMIYTRLGLRHIQLRKRSEFEVDVTADYVGTSYQTWSAQCKAYSHSRVTSEHILREFGIAVLDHFSVLGPEPPQSLRIGRLPTTPPS
jgi:hypothetical protein